MGDYFESSQTILYIGPSIFAHKLKLEKFTAFKLPLEKVHFNAAPKIANYQTKYLQQYCSSTPAIEYFPE